MESDPTMEQKVVAYAEEFLKAYSLALHRNYNMVRLLIRGSRLEHEYFPLDRLEVRKDLALVAAYSEWDFMLFFINKPRRSMQRLITINEIDERFDQEWSQSTPDHIKVAHIMSYLKIQTDPILDRVSIPATNFLNQSIETIRRNGKDHGGNFGNQRGAAASKDLPEILEKSDREDELVSFTDTYKDLIKGDMTAQERGAAFETLWRKVLDFYGWRSKKIKIAGEENDFTALYEGNHILGEVRWFNESTPMNGGKMREFLGKLDPRPRTIGFFISHSGFDAGAVSVARRSVNTKTVVLFEKSEIEKVLIEHTNPADLFDEKLREVYDSVFERYHELAEEK